MAQPSPVLIERRLTRLVLLFGLGALGLIVRLYVVAVAQSPDWKKAVDDSRTKLFRIPARRGDIVDRSGTPLARTIDTYAVHVRPSVFRESNRIDALGDCATAWLGLSPANTDSRPAGATDEAARRLKYYHAVYEQRADLARKLLGLRPADLEFGREALAELFRGVIAPEGRLYVSNSGLAAHLKRSLLSLSDRDVVATTEILTRRLKSAATVAEALAVDETALSSSIDAEWHELEDLANAVKSDLDEFLLVIFGGEIKEARHIEERLEDLIDDRIAVQNVGTYDFGGLSADELADKARELEVPSTDLVRVEAAWNALLALEPAGMEKDAAADRARRVADVGQILRGRPLARALDFEVPSIARLLGVWSKDPDVVKRALGQKVRAQPEFKRSDYIAPEKEWPRRLQFKGSYAQEITQGAGFETAQHVWSLFGLGRIGFEVEAGLGREYRDPEHGSASLLIGRLTKRGDPLGGLEEALNAPPPNGIGLEGTPGSVRRIQEIDGSWREIAAPTPPVHGHSVKLTLDVLLQETVEGVLERMISELGVPGDPSVGGGACIIDIENGDILTLASAPRVPDAVYHDRWSMAERIGADREAARHLLRAGIWSKSEFEIEMNRLGLEDDAKYFVERAADAGRYGYYPPGSVMKTFVALLALQEGVVDPNEHFVCRTDKRRHGTVDMHQALVVSCNAYFQDLGMRLGTQKVIDYAKRLGMFTEVDWLIAPETAEARYRATLSGSPKNVAIGQESISTSPLEVASMMATVARRGRAVTPRIVLDAGPDFAAKSVRADCPIDDQRYEFLVAALREVVTHAAVAEKRLKPFLALDIAGKTGTAEGYFEKRHAVENCAWFAGFAPAAAPRFAIAVFCEHTNAMGKNVAPFAAEMIKATFDRYRP